MFYNKDDLGKSTTRPEVREYCLLQSCRRHYLAKRFGLGEDVDVQFPASKLHACCDNCTRRCECEDCISARATEGHGTKEKIPSSDDIVTSFLFQTLSCVFETINQEVKSSMDATYSTGLTGSLANDISENYPYFMDFDALCIMYSYLKDDYLRAIHSVLLNCREFMEN